MPKLSQIAAAGAPPAVTDTAVFVTGGTIDNLVTVTQLAAGLPAFTAALKGSVPASGGGTTNFLRADGTFAAPPATAPGGVNPQFQFNNLGAFGGTTGMTWDNVNNVMTIPTGSATHPAINFSAASEGIFSTVNTNLTFVANASVVARVSGTSLFGIELTNNASFSWDSTNNFTGVADTFLFRDAANIIGQRNGTTAQSLRIYNSFTDASNYERAIIDWNLTANTFTIATQAAGSGTGRGMVLNSVNAQIIVQANGSPIMGLGTAGAIAPSGAQFCFIGAANPFGGAQDASISRVTGKVMAFGDGSANANGWIQTAGDQRVGSDIGYTSSVVLTQVMSAVLLAGRTYSFDIYLSITGSAGGVQAALVAAAGLTATDIRYDGYVVDNAAGGTKGAAQAAALGTVVANPATITGPASATIRGTITVNVAGTISIQASQATSSATTTTVKRGSWAFFRDVP